MLLRHLILQRSALDPDPRTTSSSDRQRPTRTPERPRCPQRETPEPRRSHRQFRSTMSKTLEQGRSLQITSRPDRNCPDQDWWRRSDSNRRPEACKAPALPTELRPRISLESRQSRAARPWAARYRRRGAKLVGQGRLELPTSRLSSARSNQLSY